MKLRQLAIGGLAAVAAVASACVAPAPGGGGGPTYTDGPCPDSSGVTVVVDFTADLSDEQLVRCAIGPQESGLAALLAIGLAINTNAANAEPGTVCTLEGLPVEGYPYCWLTDGYWSYWRAPSTAGAWDFAPTGPSDGPLVEGTVEGWAWAQGFVSDGPRLGPDGDPLQ
ncbi:MAG: hypothetical protein GY812_01085 [Actinomycetia bacterium]|nr:hypothetical protein [Actinomycetes bacterium]